MIQIPGLGFGPGSIVPYVVTLGFGLPSLVKSGGTFTEQPRGLTFTEPDRGLTFTEQARGLTFTDDNPGA